MNFLCFCRQLQPHLWWKAKAHLVIRAVHSAWIKLMDVNGVDRFLWIVSFSLTDIYFLLDYVKAENTVRLTIRFWNSQVTSPCFSTAYSSLLWAGKTPWSHKTLGSTPKPPSLRYHFAGKVLSSSCVTFFRSLHEILRPLKRTLQCYSEHIWYSSPITGLDRSRGFQEVKASRFRDNDTGWW